jgi:hypothetical protein
MSRRRESSLRLLLAAEGSSQKSGSLVRASRAAICDSSRGRSKMPPDSVQSPARLGQRFLLFGVQHGPSVPRPRRFRPSPRKIGRDRHFATRTIASFRPKRSEVEESFRFGASRSKTIPRYVRDEGWLSATPAGSALDHGFTFPGVCDPGLPRVRRLRRRLLPAARSICGLPAIEEVAGGWFVPPVPSLLPPPSAVPP